MNNNLQGFDPLLFLGISNLQGAEKDNVAEELLDKISRYIAVRTAELLPDEDVKNADGNADRLFSSAKEKIPDFNAKIKIFLEDYKKEYNNSLQ